MVILLLVEDTKGLIEQSKKAIKKIRTVLKQIRFTKLKAGKEEEGIKIKLNSLLLKYCLLNNLL